MGQWSLDDIVHLCKVPVIMNTHEVWSVCPTITWLSFSAGKT